MEKKFYKALLKRRCVPLFGRADEKNFERINASIFYLNSLDGEKEIKFPIDSKGGIVGYGMDIHDLIMMSTAPVTGIVIGRAYSMAAVVLQACDERIAAPHAEILVHPTTIEVKMFLRPDGVAPFGVMDWGKLREDVSSKSTEGTLQKIIEIFCNRTGRPPAEIIALVNKETAMSAEEALRNGFLDRIATPGELSR